MQRLYTQLPGYSYKTAGSTTGIAIGVGGVAGPNPQIKKTEFKKIRKYTQILIKVYKDVFYTKYSRMISKNILKCKFVSKFRMLSNSVKWFSSHESKNDQFCLIICKTIILAEICIGRQINLIFLYNFVSKIFHSDKYPAT
jgi:hypothetical protein